MIYERVSERLKPRIGYVCGQCTGGGGSLSLKLDMLTFDGTTPLAIAYTRLPITVIIIDIIAKLTINL